MSSTISFQKNRVPGEPKVDEGRVGTKLQLSCARTTRVRSAVPSLLR